MEGDAREDRGVVLLALKLVLRARSPSFSIDGAGISGSMIAGCTLSQSLLSDFFDTAPWVENQQGKVRLCDPLAIKVWLRLHYNVICLRGRVTRMYFNSAVVA